MSYSVRTAGMASEPLSGGRCATIWITPVSVAPISQTHGNGANDLPARGDLLMLLAVRKHYSPIHYDLIATTMIPVDAVFTANRTCQKLHDCYCSSRSLGICPHLNWQSPFQSGCFKHAELTAGGDRCKPARIGA